MFKQFIQDGIINVQEANTLNQKNTHSSRNIVFIDATFVLPTSDHDIYQNHIDRHISGALFFDIKSVADKESDLPHMIPSANTFSDAMSAMGIHNSDFIIIYAQHGMIMGPARLWWMLKGFGHEDVAVLNGGLPKWIESDLPISSGEATKRLTSQFRAAPFNGNLYADKDLVTKVSDNKSYPIIDARPKPRFKGETAEPRANMRSGHIPNSINLPCSQLVNEDATFKTKEQITGLFDDVGFDIKHAPNDVVLTCGSGITACALALGLHYIGYAGHTHVYDGSWSEWGRIE